jgi:hypothetical protein
VYEGELCSDQNQKLCLLTLFQGCGLAILETADEWRTRLRNSVAVHSMHDNLTFEHVNSVCRIGGNRLPVLTEAETR